MTVTVNSQAKCLPRLNLKYVRQQALLLAPAHYAGLAELAEQLAVASAWLLIKFIQLI